MFKIKFKKFFYYVNRKGSNTTWISTPFFDVEIKHKETIKFNIPKPMLIKFGEYYFKQSNIHPDKWRLLDSTMTCVTPKYFNHWYEIADYTRNLR